MLSPKEDGGIASDVYEPMFLGNCMALYVGGGWKWKRKIWVETKIRRLTRVPEPGVNPAQDSDL